MDALPRTHSLLSTGGSGYATAAPSQHQPWAAQALVTPRRGSGEPRKAPLSPSHKTNSQRHDEVQQLVSQLWRVPGGEQAAPQTLPQAAPVAPQPQPRRSAIEEYEAMLRARVAEATAARGQPPPPGRSGTEQTQHTQLPGSTAAPPSHSTAQWGTVFGAGQDPHDMASYPSRPPSPGVVYASRQGSAAVSTDAFSGIGVAVSVENSPAASHALPPAAGRSSVRSQSNAPSQGVPSSAVRSGSAASRVYDRSEHWKAGRQEHLDALRAQRLEEEHSECPFAPKINSTSSVMAGGTETGKRLEGDVVFRLYSAKKQSSSNLAAERRKAQEKEAEECTFHPQLNKNDWTDSVVPRYLDPGDHTADDPFDASHGTASTRGKGGRRKVEYNPDKECTFQPKTTKYLAIHTQDYLETDAFERLSVPTRKGANGALPNTHRWYSEQGEGTLHYPPNVNTKAGGARRSRSAGGGSGRHQQEMDGFFKRLNEDGEKRLENLEYLRQQDPWNTGFKPKVNRKSAEIVARTRTGFGIERDPNAPHPNLFSRLHSEKKAHRSRARSNIAAMRPATEDEEECSFHPTITPSAQSLRPRTVEEMSYGDHQRNEERRKQHALARYRREVEECPFAPTLNHSVDVKSKVSVRTDPTGFVKWAKQRQEQRLHYLENEQRKRQDEENDECTFHPKVHTAPAYISTIAKSVSIAKASEKKSKHGTGPAHTFGYS